MVKSQINTFDSLKGDRKCLFPEVRSTKGNKYLPSPEDLSKCLSGTWTMEYLVYYKGKNLTPQINT